MFKKIIANIFYCIFFILIPNATLLAKPPIFVDKPEDALILSVDLELDALLIFTSSFCQPCLALKKDLNQNLTLIDNMIICYIDFNQRQDLVKEFQVKTVPDTIVYRDNKEIKRKIGYKSKQEFEEWIKR